MLSTCRNIITWKQGAAVVSALSTLAMPESVPAQSSCTQAIRPLEIKVVPHSNHLQQSISLTFDTNQVGTSVAYDATLFFVPALEGTNVSFTTFNYHTGEIGNQTVREFPSWGTPWIPLRRLPETPEVTVDIGVGFKEGYFCALPMTNIVVGQIRNNIRRTGPTAYEVTSTVYELPGSTISNLGVAAYRLHVDGSVSTVFSVSPPHASFTSYGVNYSGAVEGNETISNSIGFFGPSSGVPANWNSP